MSISIAGLMLGIIDIGIVAVCLLLVGLLVLWILSMFEFVVPARIQKLYVVLILLIALYMLVALLLGMSTFHIIPRIT